MDANLTIDQACLVYMYPGAQIVVQPGAELTVDFAFIMNCTDMWDRILLEPESRLKVLGGSLITHANTAVYAQDGSEFIIENSKLWSNVVGVYVPPNALGNFNNIQGIIEGTEFAHFLSFPAPFHGQPAFGLTPRAGVELNDMVMDIGNNLATHNFFGELNMGILSNNSIIKVENSQFWGILEDMVYTDPENGCAVASNGNATIQSLKVENCYFTHCDFGVHTSGVDLNVTDNQMYNFNKAAVYSENCSNMLTSSVSGCVIGSSNYGIDWRNNAGAGGMSVFNNDFSFNDPGIAINLEEINNTAPANYLVKFNRIINDGGGYGIIAKNVYSPLITINDLFQNGFNPQTPYVGISLDGCEKAQVQCNTVTGNYPAFNDNWGIKVNISNANQIRHNEVDATYTGLEFNGMCGSTLLKANRMNHHWEGLVLDASAVIGVQNHHGNRWLGPFNSGFGARNDNIGGLNSSQFNVHTASGTIYHPLVAPINLNWFNQNPGNPYTGGIGACTQLIANGGGGNSAGLLEQSIASGSFQATGYPDETRHMARRYLYDVLLINPSMMNNSTLLSQYFQQQQTASVGHLSRVTQGIAGLYTFQPGFTTTFGSLRQSLNAITDSISIIDSLRRAGTTIAGYNQVRQGLNTSLNSIRQTITALVINRNTVMADSAVSILADNDTVQPAQAPEQNEKIVNRMFLVFETQGSAGLSFAHIANLETIAAQCPLYGGPAVYRARTILGLMSDSLQFDDSACMQQAASRLASPDLAVPITNDFDFYIFPNPASMEFTISFSGETGEGVFVEITDLAGRVVLCDHDLLFEGKKKYSTVVLNPGNYFAKARTLNGTWKTKRLVIIK